MKDSCVVTVIATGLEAAPMDISGVNRVPIVNKPRFGGAVNHVQPQPAPAPTMNTQSMRPVVPGHTGTIPQIRPSVAQTEIKIPGFLSRNNNNKDN